VRVPRGLSLEQAHQLRRDRAILEIQENIRALPAQIQQLMNQPRAMDREPSQDPPGGCDSPSDSHYSSGSSTRDVRSRKKIVHRDDLKNLIIEALEFDGNLKLEECLEWLQAMERIIEIKGYSRKKAFKLAILKLKQYALLWYENLNRTRAFEGKPKINTWFKLKKYMDKRFLPATYKQELYLRVTLLQQGNMKVEEYIREFEQLQIRCSLREKPNQTIARFLRA